jgi:hypothetical protein
MVEIVTISVRSYAMRPLAWFCAILIPSGVAGLALGRRPDFDWVFLGLIGYAVLLYAGAYAYWAKTDPDRLGV